jgi:UDP-N-acetylglucosamine--dolichyl-phosphate N-acetylglucosaminephosphotransferase
MLTMIISLLIGFIVTFLITPKTIIFLERIGIVGTDIQKFNRPKIAEMGGLPVLMGFLSAVFTFVWITTFIIKSQSSLISIFAGISTILIITLIGMLDDMSTLMKRPVGRFKKIGLKQWQKPLLTLPAAIPLMAIMAGSSQMSVPFIGTVDFGILYPLILVPIAIVGSSNAFNMLAGLNGLEAGLGTVLLSTLGIYAYTIGEIQASIIALSIAVSLLAFLFYNWNPAKILPGDSLVYMIGASVAIVAVIGNMEKIALLAFLPWFFEFLLKARSRFKAESFGRIEKDGILTAPYKKIYSLTHIPMKLGKFSEQTITSILIITEALLCVFLLWFYTFVV